MTAVSRRIPKAFGGFYKNKILLLLSFYVQIQTRMDPSRTDSFFPLEMLWLGLQCVSTFSFFSFHLARAIIVEREQQTTISSERAHRGLQK
jgi:hypothetical protein